MTEVKIIAPKLSIILPQIILPLEKGPSSYDYFATWLVLVSVNA
jgi:hypothetical protein